MYRKKASIIIVCVFVMCCMVYIAYYNHTTSLSSLCAGQGEANYVVFLTEDTTKGIQEVQIDETLLEQLLEKTSVKKGRRFDIEPVPSFDVKIIYENVAFSLVIGADGSVIVARYDDLSESRTFWQDQTKQLFSILYNNYSINSGSPKTQ